MTKPRVEIAVGGQTMNVSAFRERETVLRWVDPGAAPRGLLEKLIREGAVPAAEIEASRRLDARPTDLDALCLAAISRLMKGDSGGASEFFGRAVEAHPRSPMAWALKGLLADNGGNGQAGRSLARAIRLRPQEAWPWALRSQWRRAQGDLGACRKDLDAALSRGKSAWAHRLRAECLESLGEMEAAIADAQAAISMSPRRAELHELRGHCLFQKKDYRGADASFSRALRLDPKRTGLLERRADCRWLAGRGLEAIGDILRCLRLEPKSGRHRLRLARLLVLSGKAAGLTPLLRGLRGSKDPRESAGAGHLSGILSLRRRRFAQAAREFARAESIAGGERDKSAGVAWSALARGLDFMKRHRKTLPEERGRPRLILAGLGLDYPYQATLELLGVLSDCDIIVNNLAGAEAMEFLSVFCRDVRTISFEGRHSRRWADRVLRWLKPGLKVAFVTRGHPLVSGHLAHELIRRSRGEGIDLRCYGAISSVDQILALTGEVLGETFWGMQMVDSQLLNDEGLEYQTGLPLILYLSLPPGEGARAEQLRCVARLESWLKAAYPAGHRLFLFGPRYDLRRLEEARLEELPKRLRGVDERMFSSMILLVPPVKALAPRAGGSGRKH